MKYFTPDVIKRMNARDMKVVAAALEVWEKRGAAYERRLNAIWIRLPRSLKRYLSECRLHDAHFHAAIEDTPRRLGKDSRLSLFFRQEDRLFSLRYDLARQPSIKMVLPPELCGDPPLMLYDEIDIVRRGLYEHRILLSTGEELTVRFRKFQLVEGHWLLPVAKKKLKAVS